MKTSQFLEAYEAFADAIFRYCYFRVSDRELAKDLTQETFTRAWIQISRGVEMENIRAFLYKVAGNLIIDEYRKKKPVSLDKLQESGFEPVDSDQPKKIEDIVDGKKFLAFLDGLDDSSREIIIMRYINDLSPKEIAGILGETENTVSVRIHRSLNKIRELYGQTF